MNRYDAVIIGAGLGGLECGAILSREGFRVLILEKNDAVGGCLQTYCRKGYLLDTGIHYISAMDHGEILRQAFRLMKIEQKLNLCRMDENCFDEILYCGQPYRFAMEHHRFADTLSLEFPTQREALLRYAEKLKQAGDELSPQTIAERGFNFSASFHRRSRSAVAAIADCFTSPLLQQVIAGNNMSYGGQEKSTSFYQHAACLDSYIRGAYRLMGGSRQIADALQAEIESNGGEVITRCHITRLEIKNGVAECATDSNGQRYYGNTFISDIHPLRTVELSPENPCFRPAFISRLQSLPPSYGIFTLYLLAKPNAIPYCNHNIHIHSRNNAWDTVAGSDLHIKHCAISHHRSGNIPFTNVVVLLTPVPVSLFEEWENTACEQRGDDYRHLKNLLAENLLRFAAENGYSFTDKIFAMETSTPLSYRHYTGSPDGSAYGMQKDWRMPHTALFSHKTKVKNLFLCGQNINYHGALGVSVTSLMLCADLLGNDYLSKKISNA